MMKKIMKKITHHFDFFWLSVVMVFQDVFSYQILICKFSPQYGHCITLLSRALLHFGHSL